ncbi:MAG: pitrilysin family protein [candidate division Zixibacteria bacterium]
MKKMITILISTLLCLTAVSFAGDIKLPPITEKTLENGLEIIIIENHELPVVYFNMVMASGSICDKPGKEGLANFTANMISKGTETRTAVGIAEEIDFVGGSLTGSADRDAIYINSGVLVRHFDVALNLLSDIIINPVFSDEEIERLRKKTLSEIIQSKDNPSKVCANAFDTELFGSHPYGHPLAGTKESLEEIGRDDVVGFYDTYFRPNNSFLVIAGDIEPVAAIERVSEFFDNWEKKSIPQTHVTSPAAVEGKRVLLIDTPDATQTYIRFGNFGITRQSDDYYSFMVMNYILGSGVSFINRLMQQVRDEAGLTYDIRTVNEFNILPGAYYCNTFTENDSTLRAIDAAMRIMKDMAENPVSDDEYKNAVSFYTGYYPTTLETPSRVAREIIKVKLYDLPLSYIEDFTKNILEVKKSDVLDIAEKIIDTENIVFVVVSKAKDVQKDLETLGPVTVKNINDL